VFQVKHASRDDVTDRLRIIVRGGQYGPGDRLPPERTLMELLNVGRSPLRRALEALERDGLIWRHVGKGTFVSQTSSWPTDTGTDLAQKMTPLSMMRARLCIEPAIAREAAINASGQAIERIGATMELARTASTWSEYAHQDNLFHRAIAEASDNFLLIEIFNKVNQVQREIAWTAVKRSSPRPPSDHSSFAEHEAILKAIKERDTDATFHATRRHLQSVLHRLYQDGKHQ